LTINHFQKLKEKQQKSMLKTFPIEFKTYGKGRKTSSKPQKSSMGLTGYFLTRWFLTKVSIIIIDPHQRALIAQLPIGSVNGCELLK
jgi:hypothetical protein